jgi:hypothetical protein
VINVLAWRITAQLVKPVIDGSRNYLAGLGTGRDLPQLDAVADYMYGQWHRKRFATMFFLLVLADTTSILITPLHSPVIQRLYLQEVLPFLPDIAILAFVLVAEVWIWCKRLGVLSVIRLHSLQHTIDPEFTTYMNGFFELQFKSINYLLISHAAAILSILTFVRDYLTASKSGDKNTPMIGNFYLAFINEIGALVGIFAGGLVLAVFAFIMISISRDRVMSALAISKKGVTPGLSSYFALTFSAGSTLLLVSGIIIIAVHFLK